MLSLGALCTLHCHATLENPLGQGPGAHFSPEELGGQGSTTARELEKQWATSLVTM